MTTDADSLIIVLGATNRPSDLDKAILRRMKLFFKLDPPGTHERHLILRKILSTTRCDASFDLLLLAAATEGFTGSDIKELCRAAALVPLKERMRSMGQEGISDIDRCEPSANLRSLSMEDFLPIIEDVRNGAHSLLHRNQQLFGH